jgi:hypothetical protein
MISAVAVSSASMVLSRSGIRRSSSLRSSFGAVTPDQLGLRIESPPAVEHRGSVTIQVSHGRQPVPHLQHRGERIGHPLLQRFGHLAAVGFAAPGQLELDDVAGLAIVTDHDAPALPVRTGGAAEARGAEPVRFLVQAGSVGRGAETHHLIRKPDGPDRDLGLIDRAVGGMAQPELGEGQACPGKAIAQFDCLIETAAGLPGTQH